MTRMQPELTKEVLDDYSARLDHTIQVFADFTEGAIDGPEDRAADDQAWAEMIEGMTAKGMILDESLLLGMLVMCQASIQLLMYMAATTPHVRPELSALIATDCLTARHCVERLRLLVVE